MKKSNQPKQPVYFKYENSDGRTCRFKVLGICYEGEPEINDFGYVEIPEGKIRTIKCKCGCNDWNEDGRFINEYCCNSCGRYVDVYEDRKTA